MGAHRKQFRPRQRGAQTPLINFGNSGTSANRSLGTYTAIYSKDVAFALVLRNDTATVFSNFTLSYFGEQWAVNAQRGDASMKLDFSYGVFSSFNGAAPNPNTVIPHSGNTPDPLRFYEGYTRPANGALNFAAFQFSFENQSIDGNAPENRRLISSTQPADWAPGQFLVLRRFNDYGFGSGQIPAKLAVNDVQVTAGGAVPEPGSAVLLALGAAMLGARRKRANVHRDSTQD